jgi:hypothetical protein
MKGFSYYRIRVAEASRRALFFGSGVFGRNRLLIRGRQTDAMMTEDHGCLRSGFAVPASAGGGQAESNPPEGGTTNGNRPKDLLFCFILAQNCHPLSVPRLLSAFALDNGTGKNDHTRTVIDRLRKPANGTQATRGRERL